MGDGPSAVALPIKSDAARMGRGRWLLQVAGLAGRGAASAAVVATASAMANPLPTAPLPADDAPVVASASVASDVPVAPVAPLASRVLFNARVSRAGDGPVGLVASGAPVTSGATSAGGASGASGASGTSVTSGASAAPGASGAGTSGARSEARNVRPLWELGLGAAVVRLSDYRGSDEGRTYVLPLPYVVYRGTWLRADRDGARALLFESPRVTVDISIAGAVPVRSRDNAARRGMSDLAPTVELGPNLNYRLAGSGDSRVRLDLRLPLRVAVAVQRSPEIIGTTFSPHLNLDVQGLPGGWKLGMLGGPVLGDRRYHAYYYDVGTADATAIRPRYDARGGYGGWRALAAVSRRVGPVWMGGFIRHDSLRGAVFADSPLVRRPHDLMAGFGISWVFATSGQLVSALD